MKNKHNSSFSDWYWLVILCMLWSGTQWAVQWGKVSHRFPSNIEDLMHFPWNSCCIVFPGVCSEQLVNSHRIVLFAKQWCGAESSDCVLSLLEFHGLEEWLLLRALQTLQSERKAEIITLADSKGVKFFWCHPCWSEQLLETRTKIKSIINENEFKSLKESMLNFRSPAITVTLLTWL